MGGVGGDGARVETRDAVGALVGAGETRFLGGPSQGERTFLLREPVTNGGAGTPVETEDGVSVGAPVGT